MKVAQVRKLDIANGPGIRASIFVSGCTHNCKNCFNKEYQNFNYGLDFSQKEQEIMSIMENPMVTGLNVLGGEPLQQINDTDLQNLLESVSKTEKPIWLWTGYTFEEILASPNKDKLQGILQYVDILIDGRFIEEKKNLNLKYRGSSNQRVLDCKKSLEQSKATPVDIL